MSFTGDGIRLEGVSCRSRAALKHGNVQNDLGGGTRYGAYARRCSVIVLETGKSHRTARRNHTDQCRASPPSSVPPALVFDLPGLLLDPHDISARAKPALRA